MHYGEATKVSCYHAVKTAVNMKEISLTAANADPLRHKCSIA